MEATKCNNLKMGGSNSITLADTNHAVRELIQSCATEYAPCRALLNALQKCSGIKVGNSNKASRILETLADNKELPWIVAETYSRLWRKENNLPDGTVFTPPWLANEVVEHLLPGLTVVDLGAGSGMLTLTAARKGFRVIAVEEDRELVMILDSLIRIMQLQKNIELRVCDALSYSCDREAQIMANPPFTRHHSIPIQKKRMLAKMVSERGLHMQMTTGYYGYFMIHAWTSEWSKRDVFLLPTNWLETQYGNILRQMLLTRGYEISLVENGCNSPVFDNALTTICLVTTWRQPSEEKKRESEVPVKIFEGPNGGATRSANSKDNLSTRLSKRLSGVNANKCNVNHTIADVFRVRRGIATGHNDFFILSDAKARSLEIEPRELKKVLRRLPVNSENPDVAYLWAPGDIPSEASLRRILEGEELGVDKRYLCAHRKKWWRVEFHSSPAYLVAYMGRGHPRIIENREGLLTLNNIHGLYIREGVSPSLAKKIIKWLLSKDGVEALVGQARHFYGGMWKLEPGDVEQTILPSSLF